MGAGGYATAIVIAALTSLFVVGLKRVVLRAFMRADEQVHVHIDRYAEKKQAERSALPQAEQAEHDIRQAEMAKYGGAAALGTGAVIAAAFNPLLWFIPGIIATKWAIRNWRTQDESIREAKRRRAEAISS